ncbi:DUF6232 family protein [Pedobacter endophyticus]|uniref:QacE n=1 Tax=Pedobacter endophyticus TaxID=2789740 RepID=A0A7U3Q3I1_9SPHI|nr:DUF6232 family protein [Pedobacter endophyticus]QPH37843.1 QacE [Pedobacter endophyticus]
MEPQLQNEVMFYQDTNVTVTQSRFVARSKTYAMRNISSVHISEVVKSKTLPVIMIVVGILLLLPSETKIVGSILAVIGIVLILYIKNDFAVRISTNSGEVNSIVSEDKTYIKAIVNALNDAIVYRG